MLKIRITDPLGNAAKYALPDEPGAQYVLGRAEDCDVVLANDGSLSRHHALLIFEGDRWCIQDNQSVNGVRLGEVPVLYTSLQPGAVFFIGCTQMEVLSVGVAAPSAPPEPEAQPEDAPAYPPEAPAYSAEPSALAEIPLPEALEESIAAPEPSAIESAPPEPQPVPVSLPPRHRTLRRPAGSGQKPAPKALRNGKGESVARVAKEKRELPTRALKHIEGAEEAAQNAPKRRMRNLERVETPVGSPPAAELELPVDFELQFFLSEPQHAVTSGSILRFGLVAAFDCHIFLVQHDSMGGICLLVPGTVKGRAELRAGKATALPPKGMMAADELVATAPFGRDTVVAVACTAPCRFAHHLQALLQGDTPPPARPGAVEKLAIELCREEMAENPPRWTTSVLYIDTFPAAH